MARHYSSSVTKVNQLEAMALLQFGFPSLIHRGFSPVDQGELLSVRNRFNGNNIPS